MRSEVVKEFEEAAEEEAEVGADGEVEIAAAVAAAEEEDAAAAATAAVSASVQSKRTSSNGTRIKR